MSDFTEARNKVEENAKQVGQTFLEWFHAKPWHMTAIIAACMVMGWVVGKFS